MQEILDELGKIFENLPGKNLALAISDKNFQDLALRLPFVLPSNLERLYKWHNGINSLIPAYDFLSLSDAISQYEELIAFGEDEQDETFFGRTCLPILQFEGSYFFVDCAQANSAIYYFSYESEAIKAYESLPQMLQIIADAYLSRAYYIEDDLVLEDPVLLRKITDKYCSTEDLDARELEWNKLCAEIDASSNPKVDQELSPEEVRLQELSDALGLAPPSVLKKESWIRRLTNTHDERAIAFLVSFLTDSNPEIVAKAACGLGELKARAQLPELLKLTKHSAEVVRNLATCAIAEIISPNDQLMLELLLPLLSDGSALVRIAATQAVGKLRSTGAVEPLTSLLSDKNSGVLIYAIEALGKIGDVRTVAVLEKRKESVSSLAAQTIDRAILLIEKANS